MRIADIADDIVLSLAGVYLKTGMEPNESSQGSGEVAVPSA